MEQINSYIYFSLTVQIINQNIVLLDCMLPQEEHETNQSSSPFKKGMTLDQYLAEMQNTNHGDSPEQKPEEDLYQTSKKNGKNFSKKLITYQIRESEEDEYQESVEEAKKVRLHNYESKLSTNLQQSIPIPNMYRQNLRQDTNISQDTKVSMSNSKGFRVRRQSNSPFSQLKKEPSSSFSPGKNFFHTLHQNQWNNINSAVNKKNLNPQGSTTLYGKFLKGVKQKQNEQHFKKKNNRQLQYVIKYERQVNSKYSGFDMNGFRVQGVNDKLHERRPGKIHR